MERHITIKGGLWGGVVGGVVFGVLMAMVGMMPMIAMLVGSESVVVGWVVHLLISAGTGALFALLFSHMIHHKSQAVWFGVLYGVLWWVLGALILMPSLLGMGVQFANMFDQMRMMSLLGHLIFGVLLAIVAYRGTNQ